VRENFARNICVSESNNATVKCGENRGLPAVPPIKGIGEDHYRGDSTAIQVPGHPESLSERTWPTLSRGSYVEHHGVWVMASLISHKLRVVRLVPVNNLLVDVI
jgi:hypothetical protein